MTVRELVYELLKMPPDHEVIVEQSPVFVDPGWALVKEVQPDLTTVMVVVE